MDQIASNNLNEVKNFCKINNDDFKNNLASLVKNKIVSLKQPIEQLEEINYNTTYEINDNFDSKSKVIKCQPKS